MEKIKLNKGFGEITIAHDYELDATKKYVINIQEELEQQLAIMGAIQTMGLSAIGDYHKWLDKNGFDIIEPNPTNEFVSKYYGVKPLWKTGLSQGVVMKDEDDYYIIMECSRLNEGFKYTQIVLTLFGCL